MSLTPKPSILQANRSLDLGQAVRELAKHLRERGWNAFRYIVNDVGKGYNVSIGIGDAVFGKPSVARSMKEARHIACEHALSKIDEWPQYPELSPTSTHIPSRSKDVYFLGKNPKGPIEDIVEKAKQKGIQRFAVVNGTGPAIVKAIEDAGGEIVVVEKKGVEPQKRKRDDDDEPTSLPDLGAALAFRPAPAAETVFKRARVTNNVPLTFRPKPKPK